MFLSLIGQSTYKTLRNLLSPDKPGDRSYADLVGTLSKHYKPAPSEIVERFRFNTEPHQEAGGVDSCIRRGASGVSRVLQLWRHVGGDVEGSDSLLDKRRFDSAATSFRVEVGLREGLGDRATTWRLPRRV